MTLQTALIRSRAKAARRMTDACTTRRQDGFTYDADDQKVPNWVQVYAGPCRISQPGSGSSSASRVSAGEADVLLQTPEWHVPMSAPLHKPGDEVTITASATDPASINRKFIVRSVPGHSQATARRYGVTERTS